VRALANRLWFQARESVKPILRRRHWWSLHPWIDIAALGSLGCEWNSTVREAACQRVPGDDLDFEVVDSGRVGRQLDWVAPYAVSFSASDGPADPALGVCRGRRLSRSRSDIAVVVAVTLVCAMRSQ
jgi:hypothetical protein